MIELNLAIVIIATELLLALILVLLVLYIRHQKKQSKEHLAVNDLINVLKENEATHFHDLEEIIKKNCHIENDMCANIVQDIRQHESSLYHHIVTIFLKKDCSLLQKINQQINNLSSIYWQVLQQANQVNENIEHHKSTDIDQQLEQLQNENTLLVQQLQTAMQTMDEISAEYTKVFGGTQSDLELENSRKKMIKVFQGTEKNFNSITHR